MPKTFESLKNFANRRFLPLLIGGLGLSLAGAVSAQSLAEGPRDCVQGQFFEADILPTFDSSGCVKEGLLDRDVLSALALTGIFTAAVVVTDTRNSNNLHYTSRQ